MEQKARDVLHQSAVDVALFCRLTQPHEVEVVGIFRRLARQVRLRRGQAPGKLITAGPLRV